MNRQMKKRLCYFFVKNYINYGDTIYESCLVKYHKKVIVSVLFIFKEVFENILI